MVGCFVRDCVACVRVMSNMVSPSESLSESSSVRLTLEYEHQKVTVILTVRHGSAQMLKFGMN